MKRYICTTLFAAAATFAQSAQGASDTVSFVDFENREVGVYGNAEAKEDFKRNDYDKSWWYAMDKNNGENSKIVHDGEEHGNVLQLKYPKGCVGPSDNDTPACAAQIIQPLVKTADTMWSAYDTVKVDKFYLSTFHGGSSTEWAPTHDCFIRYDNFTVSTDSIAIAVNAATDTTPATPDTSSTTRIMTQSQNRSAATPVKIYRIDGTLVGREIRPNETRTYRLENGKKVKIGR